MIKKLTEETELMSDIQKRLDAIIALLLRNTDENVVGNWKKKNKSEELKMLIDFEFSNDEIAKILDLAYKTVANARSKYKSKGK